MDIRSIRGHSGFLSSEIGRMNSCVYRRVMKGRGFRSVQSQFPVLVNSGECVLKVFFNEMGKEVLE